MPVSGVHRGRSGSWHLQSPFEWAIPGATGLLYFKADAAELSPTVLLLLSSRCPQGSSSFRKIQRPFRGKEGWIWLLPPPGPEQTTDTGHSRTWCVSSPSAMNIIAWVLHVCILARPTSEAENQAGSLHWRCCLPPWYFPTHRSPGSGLHDHMSTVSLQPAPSPCSASH